MQNKAASAGRHSLFPFPQQAWALVNMKQFDINKAGQVATIKPGNTF